MKDKKGYNVFCDYIKDKKISLIGLGISNLPLVQFLYKSGASSVIIRDLKKLPDDPAVLKAVADGAKVILGNDYLENLNEDIVIRSPGIRPDLPIFTEAMEKGTVVSCETELFLQFVPCKSFAVTGSDGKTTTTTLIAKILECSGYKVHLGGNIGKAMLPQLEEISSENDVSVTELSSFQLMNSNYSPDVAVITNLSENHLDWHRDMEEYLCAKKNILNHQSVCGVAVLNYDNEHTKKCSTKGKTVYFSRKNDFSLSDAKLENGVFLSNETICFQTPEKTVEVLSVNDILLPGQHNVENYMAAIGATFPFVTKEAICSVAKNFGGVEHRIELVRTLDRVKYYNSSIDSSPTRSIAALRSFSQKLIMIAGGYDKNLDYSALGDEICRRVKVLILCGATSEKIRRATVSSSLFDENQIQIIDAASFSDAVLQSKGVASEGDVVILSPASASFDLFKNFEERGKYFKKLVMELS